MIALEYRRLGAQSGHEAGRALLADMYARYVGGELPEICLGDRGKPYFARSEIQFSISHTKSHVFCALSDRPIGVDAEKWDRDIRLHLAEKILSPSEKGRFDAAPDKRLALLKLWVLKEAAGKCSGQGINGYPNKTDFSPDDPRISTMDGCLVAVVEG